MKPDDDDDDDDDDDGDDELLMNMMNWQKRDIPHFKSQALPELLAITNLRYAMS